MGTRTHLLCLIIACVPCCTATALAQQVLPLPAGLGGSTSSVVVLSTQDDGRVLVGGQFDSIDGVVRKNLARLNSDGSVDPTWSVPGIDGVVRAVVSSSDRVFFSGDFTHVAGAPRRYVAAVDRASGALLDWNPNPNDAVSALAISTNGSTLHVSGEFNAIGGQQDYYGFASLDSQTGSPNSGLGMIGTPLFTFPAQPASSMKVIRDGNPPSETLYVGRASGIVAVNIETGSQLNWAVASCVSMTRPVADMDFYASEYGSRVVLAGLFDQSPGCVAAADFNRSGGGTGFGFDVRSANDAGQVDAVAIRDGKVFLAGAFINAGWAPRNNIVQIPLYPAFGYATDWYPTGGANGRIRAMSISGNTIFIAGAFTQVGGTDRFRIAAITASEFILADGFDGAVP